MPPECDTTALLAYALSDFLQAILSHLMHIYGGEKGLIPRWEADILKEYRKFKTNCLLAYTLSWELLKKNRAVFFFPFPVYFNRDLGFDCLDIKLPGRKAAKDLCQL